MQKPLLIPHRQEEPLFGQTAWILLVLACLATTPDRSMAAESSIGARVEQFRRESAVEWDVTRSSTDDSITRLRRASGLRSSVAPTVAPTAASTARKVDGEKNSAGVLDFVRRSKTLFGIGKHGDKLRLRQRHETPGGTHYRYERTYDGIPLYGAGFTVHTDAQGEVHRAERFGRPLAYAPTASPQVEKSEAILTVVQAWKIQTLRSDAEAHRVIYSTGKFSRQAWQVELPAEKPLGDWVVVVDAIDGTVYESHNLLKHVDGVGRVFDPNPIVTTGTTTLEDQNDRASAVPAEAYFDVALPGLDGSGYLRGSYVTIQNPTVRQTDYQYFLDRSQDGFEEIMCYYHLDRASRRIVDLGYGQIVNSPIGVVARGTTEDNSWYSPLTNTLTFGTGGVDDAEDGDVIIHEFGHYVQHRQIANFGSTPESGSLGEGFSDYWAMTNRNDDRFQGYFAMWDGSALRQSDPPYLRRLDTGKRYPEDMEGEVHADGEIWSAVLYEIFQGLGRDTTDRIVLESHEFLSPTPSFFEAMEAVFDADQALNSGAGRETIVAAARSHGLDSTIDAGFDQFVAPGAEVTLVGAGAVLGSEPVLRWRQISGETVALQDAGTGLVSFTAPASVDIIERLEFELFHDGESDSPVADAVSVYVVDSNASISEAPHVAIPDNLSSGISRTLEITDSQPLFGLGVSLGITHTYIGDLKITLTSPEGTTVTLQESNPDPTHDLHEVYFVSFEHLTNESLLAFLRENPEGNWRLRISDAGAEDLGTLDEWGLIALTGSEPGFVFSDKSTDIQDGPSGLSIRDSIDVDEAGTVSELEVYVDIEHTYVGDLTVDLVAPDGTSMRLHDRTDGGSDNITAVYHPSEDLTRLASSLTDAEGLSMEGTWTLVVKDNAPGDVGSLIAWGLKGVSADTVTVSDVRVERSILPATFRPGGSVAVTLNVDPGESPPKDITVIEALPAGLNPTAIGSGGIWDAEARALRWVLEPPLAVGLTYSVIIPSQPADTYTFEGSVMFSVGGQVHTDPIPGDSIIQGEDPSRAHAVDADADFTISTSELLVATRAWKQSQTTPTTSELLEAVTLWKQGGSYHWDGVTFIAGKQSTPVSTVE